MTKNWSVAKIWEILPKNLGQWLYLKITISTKSQMSIPFGFFNIQIRNDFKMSSPLPVNDAKYKSTM